MHGSISIENVLFSRNCDIKTTNAKSVTDASIRVMFISRNSNTLEIDNSLLNPPIANPRYGFLPRSTDQIQFVIFIMVASTRATIYSLSGGLPTAIFVNIILCILFILVK